MPTAQTSARNRLLSLLVLLATATFGADLLAAKPRTFRASEWGKLERWLASERPKLLPANWRTQVSISSPPGIDMTTAELADLRRLMVQRPRASRAIRQQWTNFEKPFVTLVGGPAHRRLAVATLLEYVAFDAAVVTMALKAEFNRARPTQFDRKFKAMRRHPAHPSYPSGHALQGVLFAEVLARLVPACTQAFRIFGFTVGRNREIAGVHYASDSDAGRKIAHQLVALLDTSPTYRALIVAAEQELLRLPAECARRNNTP